MQILEIEKYSFNIAFIEYTSTKEYMIFLTHPSVDAVTTATFPSSLRLAAAVELILYIALKVPENNILQHRRVMFQAFSGSAVFLAGLEMSQQLWPSPIPVQTYLRLVLVPSYEVLGNDITRALENSLTTFVDI